MESMFLLIPLVVVFAAVAVLVFVWAVNNGQYDDLDREAQQVLFDDEPVGAGSKPARADLESAPTRPTPASQRRRDPE